MKLDIDGQLYEIVIEKKASNRNTYIRVKKDLKIYVTTNTFTTNRSIQKLIEDGPQTTKCKAQNYKNF